MNSLLVQHKFVCRLLTDVLGMPLARAFRKKCTNDHDTIYCNRIQMFLVEIASVLTYKLRLEAIFEFLNNLKLSEKPLNVGALI